MSRYRCPDGFRLWIFNREKWRCRRCYKPVMWESGQLSHRLPASAGGMWIPENIDVLCLPCHAWVENNPLQAELDGWRIYGRIVVKYGGVTFYGVDQQKYARWCSAVRAWAEIQYSNRYPQVLVD